MNTAPTAHTELKVRHARLTVGQKKSLNRLSERWVLPRLPPDLNHAFARRAPVIMEIGAGTGDVTIELAKHHPENNYLVIEVYRGGVAQLLRQCELQQLDNVRVIMWDATAIMEQCPSRSLNTIMIFFPDPWHKKRHHKRRLLQPGLLSAMADKLTPYGRIYIATDDSGYARHIENMLPGCGLVKLAASPIMPRPRWRPFTRYEQKARLKNNAIYEWLLAKSSTDTSDGSTR